MIELRQNDLSFSVDETEKLFNQELKFKLSAEEIAALRARTEGWAAGLQLAAISMKMQGDRVSFIRGFTGSNRFIFEYLIEEVLQKQGHEIRDFLLQTSILDTLTAPLCDAVLERNNSQETLEYLERANLFLIALDDERRW
jgi:LuxR family maltose regulon positive regulatory protein